MPEAGYTCPSAGHHTRQPLVHHNVNGGINRDDRLNPHVLPSRYYWKGTRLRRRRPAGTAGGRRPGQRAQLGGTASVNFDRWIVCCAVVLGVIGLESRAAECPLQPSPMSFAEPEVRRGPPDTRIAVRATVEVAPLPTLSPTLVATDADSTADHQPAADSQLTLADLEAIALANNPTLAQADARIRAAQAKCLQVGLYPNPAIIYRGEEIGSDGRAGQQGAFFSQEIVTAGKLGHRQAVVIHEIRQAEHARWAQRGRVLNDLRASWYDVLVAQRAMELNEELVRIGQQGVKAAQDLLAALEVSDVDLLQAHVEADSARLNLNDARERHLAVWRRLTAVLGTPGMRPTRLAGYLDEDLPLLTWPESLERLLANSPELAQALSGVERARCAVVRECARRVPNLTLETGVQYQHSADDTVVGVQVGLPLPFYNRNQGNISKARAELIAARNEVRRVELALQERLATVFERYASAHRRAVEYGIKIEPNARRSLNLVRSGYTQGEFGYLTLLTAQRTYTRVSLAYLESLREVHTGSVLIEGSLLTGGLRGER